MGDALGLPGEGLSKQRQRRLLGPISGHRFLFGRGMFSDDTEHTLLTAQALIASGGDPEKFTRYLANGLRRWIILLPPGVGKATALSCLKLLVGVSPQRSGTFSAGNGPAMRTALLGVCNGGDSRHLRALVRESARLTHTDPKAEYGALAVAVAAYLATSGELSPTLFLKRLQEVLPRNNDATELMELLAKAARSVEAGETTECFAVTNQMPNGISGYMYQTVPAALHAALSHPHDFEQPFRALSPAAATPTPAPRLLVVSSALVSAPTKFRLHGARVLRNGRAESRGRKGLRISLPGL